MISPPKLFIAGQQVGDYSSWHEAELVVEASGDNLALKIALQNVLLYGSAYTTVTNLLQSAPGMPIEVRFSFGGYTVPGLIHPQGVRVAADRLYVDVELDELAIFERRVAGRRPVRVREIVVALERDADRGVVASYLIAAMLLLYTLIRETRDLAYDVANFVAHAGGGASGPIAAAAFKIAVFAIRAAFIAALAYAFYRILAELAKLLPTTRKTRTVNLAEAIEDVCSAAGYSVAVPGALRRVWLIGDNVHFYEATELITLAKRILNARAAVLSNSLGFVPRNAGLNIPLDGYAEYYTFNGNELVGRILFSLSRDIGDPKSIDLPASAEIAYTGLLGFERIQLAESNARVKTAMSDLDRIMNAARDVFRLAGRFIRNINPPPPARQGLFVVGADVFNTKIVLTDDPENNTADAHEALLRYVAGNYEQTVCRVYENVKIPFNVQTFQRLQATNWAGIRNLRWRIWDDTATVSYQVQVRTLSKTTYIL